MVKNSTTHKHKITAELKENSRTIKMFMYDALNLRTYTKMSNYASESMKVLKLEKCK